MVFFNQVQLHGELTDLTFQCCNLGFVFGDHICLGLFGSEFPTVKLDQSGLDEIG